MHRDTRLIALIRRMCADSGWMDARDEARNLLADHDSGRVPDQPPPIATDRAGSWSLVIADVEAMGVPADVIADMRERDRIGRERYGTPLTAGNGRKHLVDAYQEALDLVVYLRTEIEERGYAMNQPVREDQKRLGSLYARAIAFVEVLRAELTANP